MGDDRAAPLSPWPTDQLCGGSDCPYTVRPVTLQPEAPSSFSDPPGSRATVTASGRAASLTPDPRRNVEGALTRRAPVSELEGRRARPGAAATLARRQTFAAGLPSQQGPPTVVADPKPTNGDAAGAIARGVNRRSALPAGLHQLPLTDSGEQLQACGKHDAAGRELAVLVAVRTETAEPTNRLRRLASQGRAWNTRRCQAWGASSAGSPPLAGASAGTSSSLSTEVCSLPGASPDTTPTDDAVTRIVTSPSQWGHFTP